MWRQLAINWMSSVLAETDLNEPSSIFTGPLLMLRLSEMNPDMLPAMDSVVASMN